MVMYCDTRTDVHIHTQTHIQKKSIYIYKIIVILIVVMIRINDFTVIYLVHITPVGIIFIIINNNIP